MDQKKSRAKCRSFIADPTRHFVSATTCSTVGDFPNLPLLSHSVAQNDDSIESMQEKSASTSRPRPRHALYPKICAHCAGPCDPQLRSRPSHADVPPSPSESTDDCCEMNLVGRGNGPATARRHIWRKIRKTREVLVTREVLKQSAATESQKSEKCSD